ncbi:cation:proton antiporter [Jiella marina]|uniref:cation:proton antiporter n=1 Tax=Jiella sp. LLJ827 TaxID=2917712 RepID=UPI002101843A|nr:cation:proton antiporter [Jiella sp. LLJ827]MCQ0990480.1 cation:proton antiporter [Jiella sp. LLJ827]
MSTADLLILAIGVFLWALVSRKGERGSVTGPMVFSLFGFLVGGGAFDLIDLSIENAVIHRLAEITLVVALFCDAARIDVSKLDSQHDIPVRLLAIGLPLAMILGTLAAFVLLPHLGWGLAAIIGIILAPTDAALGQAVVSNEDVPERIRQALNVESGLNDGLAFPVLLTVLSLISGSEATLGLADWSLFLAGQLILGPLSGVTVGLVGAIAVEKASSRNWMSGRYVQISTLTLALLAYSAAETIGGNGFIAAFVAGLVVGMRSHRLFEAVEDFGETEGQLLTLTVFLLFGAILLPDAVRELEWRHVLYAGLSLTVLRMLPVAISLLGTGLRPATIGFIGWFGPRGLASILYLLLITESGALAGVADVAPTILVTVALSVLLHGATASPFARVYGTRMGPGTDGRGEHRPVHAFPIGFGFRRNG